LARTRHTQKDKEHGKKLIWMGCCKTDRWRGLIAKRPTSNGFVLERRGSISCDIN